MRASRVVLHAPVASFRHPFFVVGTQPSFDVPPPSTVHGLVAAARGSWPSPETFWFGLHVRWRAKGRDLEHQHITTRLGPRARVRVPTPDGPAVATTEIVVQPVTREFLFDVELSLYLSPDDGEAFRAPVFALTLGRSQDLAEVVSVAELDLERAERARVEHTYLPRRLRPCVRFGPTVLLSRHVSEPPVRQADFAQYIVLHEPVFLGGDSGEARTLDRVQGVDLDDLHCDPTIVDDDGYPRGVWLHRIVEPS